jgi:hypothetical protein
VNDDTRKWYKENGVMKKELYFSVPSDIKSGNWSVSINLCSTDETVSDNADYKVRFANADVWDAKTGFNLISSNVEIEYTNGSKNVTAFEQITRAAAKSLTENAASRQ